MLLPETLAQQLITTLSAALWQRPELTRLREPIETALKNDEFKRLTRQAFEHVPSDLPYFDAGFIEMPLVQQQLVAYIMEGQPETLTELERLYHKRLPAGEKPPSSIHPALENYLRRVRNVFVTHPAYGGLILARGQDAMLEAISVFRREVHDRLETLSSEQKSGFEDILKQLETLFKEPEIKALVERKQGTHIFLSYTRRDAVQAAQIRQALEAAGHIVWQDTTALKGGAEWIDSIADGIKRAYAVVSVVSEQSQQSKWVQIEYLEAERRGKTIVPIRVDGCEIPMIMLVLNVVHGHPDLPAGIQKLIEALPTPHAGEVLQQKLEHADPRQLEVAYLDKMLLEYAVWQEVYTPMAGFGQVVPDMETPDTLSASNAEIDNLFEAVFIHEQRQKTQTRDYTDILAAVADMRQLVILGDPGAGKTTTLWKIAADTAEKAKNNPSLPLPVLVRLGDLTPETWVEAQIQKQLGEVDFTRLLAQKRVVLLLDGLNELSKTHREAKVDEIKKLIELAQVKGLLAAVTCRELDYTEMLDMDIPQRVNIKPLDPLRIKTFIEAYFKREPHRGDALFWAIAGGAEIAEVWERWQAAGADFRLFWTAEDIPQENPNVHSKTTIEQDRLWHEKVKNPRSLMSLAANPYMLYMIVKVFQTFKQLPANRGDLFNKFVVLLVKREGRAGLTPQLAEHLKERLSDLAFYMQQQGAGTGIDEATALHYLNDSGLLYHARSTNILGGGDEIRFTHQLLQEYFAARRLDREMQAGTDARQFFPSSTWWQPQGWEETAILLAGLYSDDCSPVVQWLRDAQPELAVRCVQESGAGLAAEAVEQLELQKTWLPRLTDPKTDPQPQARAAIGQALGRLNLDNRKGTGLNADGLPDLDWVEIPAGEFIYGDDHKDNYPSYAQPADQQMIELPAFYISRYPITYAQFQTFVEAKDGFKDERWWEGLAAGAEHRQQPGDQKWKIANHPRENVSWYEAIAFCRWLSWKLGGVYGIDEVEKWRICLPTEQEWEKAARGTDGKFYPYGNDFDAAKGNTSETGIGQTSAVGIFPDGASPYGVLDMSGNVWEWCLTEYESGISNNITNSDGRVLRGGSWSYSQSNARAASRFNLGPHARYLDFGFRVVCRP